MKHLILMLWTFSPLVELLMLAKHSKPDFADISILFSFLLSLRPEIGPYRVHHIKFQFERFSILEMSQTSLNSRISASPKQLHPVILHEIPVYIMPFMWPSLIIFSSLLQIHCTFRKRFHSSTGKDYTIPSFFCCDSATNKRRRMFIVWKKRLPQEPASQSDSRHEIWYFVLHQSN